MHSSTPRINTSAALRVPVGALRLGGHNERLPRRSRPPPDASRPRPSSRHKGLPQTSLQRSRIGSNACLTFRSFPAPRTSRRAPRCQRTGTHDLRRPNSARERGRSPRPDRLPDGSDRLSPVPRRTEEDASSAAAVAPWEGKLHGPDAPVRGSAASRRRIRRMRDADTLSASLHGLVLDGRIVVGQPMIGTSKQSEVQAMVTEDGRLEADGETFDSVSQAARILTRPGSRKRMAFWHTEQGRRCRSFAMNDPKDTTPRSEGSDGGPVVPLDASLAPMAVDQERVRPIGVSFPLAAASRALQAGASVAATLPAAVGETYRPVANAALDALRDGGKLMQGDSAPSATSSVPMARLRGNFSSLMRPPRRRARPQRWAHFRSSASSSASTTSMRSAHR